MYLDVAELDRMFVVKYLQDGALIKLIRVTKDCYTRKSLPWATKYICLT